MESKLESLLDRFEALVSRMESSNGPSTAPQTTTQKPTGSSSSSGQAKIVKDFENEVLSKVKPFEDAALALESETVTAAVPLAILLMT